MSKQQKFEVVIPKGYKPEERQAIAAEIIDHIITRTKSGKDKDGEGFPGYSKSYMKSLDFKISGKGKKVDLTLSGEMLSSMELLKESSGKVVIGFEKDDDINGRAEGNILGSYGGSPNPKKSRDFLGIGKDQLNKILENYPLDDKQARLDRLEEVKAAGVVSQDIVDKIFFELGDE